jgi:hypothetical protein
MPRTFQNVKQKAEQEDCFIWGAFPGACRDWQVHPAEQKTWINFKVDFSAAHRELCLTNQTAEHSGFHSANMMIENHPFQRKVEAIAQFAVATASDSYTVATITATNTKLTLQLEASQAYVKKLKEDIAGLKLKIKSTWQSQRSAKTTKNDN